jgi:hypothetical protein
LTCATLTWFSCALRSTLPGPRAAVLNTPLARPVVPPVTKSACSRRTLVRSDLFSQLTSALRRSSGSETGSALGSSSTAPRLAILRSPAACVISTRPDRPRTPGKSPRASTPTSVNSAAAL